MSVEMRNVIEDIVETRLNSILENEDCCKCEQCQKDMLAYALNQLPPKYVATPKGVLYAKLNQISLQYDADVVAAVTRSVDIVSKNPRH